MGTKPRAKLTVRKKNDTFVRSSLTKGRQNGNENHHRD